MPESSYIVSQAKDHVFRKLTHELPEEMTYHTINHTRDVVNSAVEIANNEKLSDEDIEMLKLAAWFHDLGYVHGCDGHEQKSAEMAEAFLNQQNYPQSRISRIKDCIMATKMPQSPNNKLEEILCDADLMHLAQTNYFQKADLLHKEIENTKMCRISSQQWLEMNKEFLQKHNFFTRYARENYETAVKENLNEVHQRLDTWEKKKK